MTTTGAAQAQEIIRAYLRDTGQPAQAQPVLTSREQILQARKLSTIDLRKLANEQLKGAGKALSKASGVAIDIIEDPYAAVNLTPGTYAVAKLADYFRWKPATTLVDDAQAAFDRGEKDTGDTDKREHYISSWLTSRLAVQAIAEEAKFGKTDFLVEAYESAAAVKNYVAEKVDVGVSEAIKTLAKWGVIAGALYVGVKFLERKVIL